MPELEPQFLDADPATGLPNISAAELRTVYDAFVPGVIGAGDLYVTPGAGRTVNVATGVGIVPGSAAGQAKYRAELSGAAMNSDNFETGGIPAATTNPRIDQIIARVYDHTFDASGQRKWRLAVVAGTETAGATVTGRQGAVADASMPANWLRLADIITRPGMTAYAAGDIVDRRTWAGGPVAFVTAVPNNPPDGYVTDWLANAASGLWYRYRYRAASPFASKWEPQIGAELTYTALPAAPADGQVINYLADAANGVVWKLRYRAASASAYKWEFLGGAPLFSEITATDTITANTYAAATNDGPSIALPLAGDYIVAHGTRLDVTASVWTFARMSYAIGATAATDADDLEVTNTSTQFERIVGNSMRERRKNGLGVVTLAARYRIDAAGGTANFSNRWMRVIPVRLG